MYHKSGHQRDIKKTKQVAVVDVGGKEYKAYSVRGEGHEKKHEMMSKVSKMLGKQFGIDLKVQE